MSDAGSKREIASTRTIPEVTEKTIRFNLNKNNSYQEIKTDHQLREEEKKRYIVNKLTAVRKKLMDK